MAEDRSPIHERISPRLRRADLVRSGLDRLASRGKVQVNDVSDLALDNSSPIELRLDTIAALLAMEEGDEAVLHKLLGSDDRMIVVEALKSIRHFGTHWAIPELITQRETSVDASKPAILAGALADPRTSDAQSILLDVMASDTDVGVREHAIESLGEFRSPTVVKALLHILEWGSPREGYWTLWTLYSLGTLADLQTSEAIVQHLGDQTVIPEFGTIAPAACRLQECPSGSGRAR